MNSMSIYSWKNEGILIGTDRLDDLGISPHESSVEYSKVFESAGIQRSLIHRIIAINL